MGGKVKVMSYINDNLPYAKYVEKREKGRVEGVHKRHYNKSLTVSTSFHMTPFMKRKIDEVIARGDFPHKAEFFRYLIINYLEKYREREIKWEKRK